MCPDRPLSEEAKEVGQDKTTKDFIEVYDRECGKYMEQKPAVNPSTLPAGLTPFALTK